MATTPKGIYYPNNYNEIADIPEDMKKMAESIEEVFEDTDSDLSDIKEEQTTQNNRLNSLEVDNTTNKSDILTNKQDINNIKTEQTTQNTNIQTNADNISALTSRVTETEGDISDIKEEQTTQNTNISTNATNIESLQEENDNLKKIVSQLPQVTGQGTEVSLENTIEAPFTKFDVEGNSTQETTEGYNMLDLEKYSYSESSSALNGGIVTIKDGVITLNATNATGNMTALSVTKLANADSIEAGTYYFGVDVYGAYESTPNTNIWEYRGNRTLTEKFIIKQWRYAVTKGNIGSTPILISNDTSKTTYEPYTGGIALPNPDNEVPIYSAGDNENIWNGEIERGAINGDGLDVDATNRVRNVGYYELNKGTYTLSYKGAEQSVVYIFNANKVKVNNPSWENGKSTFTLEENGYIKYALKQSDNREMNVNDVSEIKLEKGNKASGYSPYGMGSINEKIQNKNVWDIDKFKNLYGTNSYETYNNVECLKLAGSRQVYDFKGEENTQYTFQFKLIGSTFNDEIGAFSLVYSDGTSDYHDGILTPKTYAFTSKANKTLVKIVWSGWSAGHFIYIDKNSMQLEPGSTASPYVEHQEQDYSIFVQQPFRSIGDVRDCFVKVDGVWNEVHYIREKDLGECTWQPVNNDENSRTQGLFTSFSVQNIENYSTSTTTIPKLLSNKYISKPNYKYQYYGRNPQDYTISTFNGNILYIQNSDFSGYTNQQVKEALAGTVLQYVLKNPTYLPCTEEQIQQLENLPSTYKDFTIIQSEDETEAYLEVSGVYDLNKLITRTEVLESEV